MASSEAEQRAAEAAKQDELRCERVRRIPSTRDYIQPPADIKIWRYMDFTKFVSLLDNQRLFLARACALGDPFEGSIPKPNLPESEAQAAERKKLETLRKSAARGYCISCWCMGDYESAAMWRLYIKGVEGVAIQSTYRRLRLSCPCPDAMMAQVIYIDYEKYSAPQHVYKNPYSPTLFVYKRLSFAHEREVRAIVSRPYPSRPSSLRAGEVLTKDGVGLPVSLAELIECVYVAPQSPEWFKELVESTVKRYGFSFQVKQSRLDDGPVY